MSFSLYQVIIIKKKIIIIIIIKLKKKKNLRNQGIELASLCMRSESPTATPRTLMSVALYERYWPHCSARDKRHFVRWTTFIRCHSGIGAENAEFLYFNNPKTPVRANGVYR